MRRAAWALVMAAMVGCSGGAGEVAPVSLDPVVSTLPPPVLTASPSSTAVTPTVVETTLADTTVPELTGPVFSDALGVKVASAPGVNTPGDTRQLLPEGLYVHIAWTADPNDPSVFTVQPDDIPILEAYANAVKAFYKAATTTRTTDDASFEQYFTDSGAKFDDSFAERRASNEVMVIGSAGVVLRPYVLSDRTTGSTAVVLDCTLEDARYESGTSVLGGMSKASGVVATMRLTEGAWLVDQVGSEAQACV
jgi:hypothetical protein